MQKLNKNAAQPGLNQKALLDLGMMCPSERIVLAFRRALEPLMKALFGKAKQIRLLTEARDRLLPKLMSGEII
jgi:type I restriction enzyme S subunit